MVTGGANGIGRAICLGLAARGSLVYCLDTDAAGGCETEALAAALLGDVKFRQADLSDPAAPPGLIADARTWAGGRAVGVLVNNVGVQNRAAITQGVLGVAQDPLAPRRGPLKGPLQIGKAPQKTLPH